MRSGLLAQFCSSLYAKVLLVSFGVFFAPNLSAEGLQNTIFQSVSWQLPNEPFMSVAVHPLQPETAVVGGETGIYLTDDGGRSWQRVLFLEASINDDSSFFQQAGQSSALGGLSEDALLEADADDYEALEELTAQQGVLPQNILPQNILPQNILPQNNQAVTGDATAQTQHGTFEIIWLPSQPNIVVAATHQGLFMSENAGRSFRRVPLGENRSEAVLSFAIVEEEPLEMVVALQSSLVYFKIDSEQVDLIKGLVEGETVQRITKIDTLKKGWVQTNETVYELHGHLARRRLSLTQSTPRGIGQDSMGNALVSNGKTLHWLPRNAMAQYRHFAWPFAPIKSISFDAGCGAGWLFQTENGWLWVPEADLGVWKSVRRGAEQFQELVCVKEGEIEHVWGVGPFGVFRELSAGEQKDMSPARLMAQWAQEPSLTQVGVWGLQASHFAYSLPMDNMNRAHVAAYMPELTLYLSYGNDGQQRGVVDLLPEQREALEDQGIDPDDLGLSEVQDTLGLGENPWGQGSDLKMFVWLRWRFHELAYWAAPWQQMSRLQPSIYESRQKRLIKLKELYDQRKTAQLRVLRRARDPLEAELWILRVEELTAQINALTGGAFARALEETR